MFPSLHYDDINHRALSVLFYILSHSTVHETKFILNSCLCYVIWDHKHVISIYFITLIVTHNSWQIRPITSLSPPWHCLLQHQKCFNDFFPGFFPNKYGKPWCHEHIISARTGATLLNRIKNISQHSAQEQLFQKQYKDPISEYLPSIKDHKRSWRKQNVIVREGPIGQC